LRTCADSLQAWFFVNVAVGDLLKICKGSVPGEFERMSTIILQRSNIPPQGHPILRLTQAWLGLR